MLVLRTRSFKAVLGILYLAYACSHFISHLFIYFVGRRVTFTLSVADVHNLSAR